MGEKKIVVPEGMLKAIAHAYYDNERQGPSMLSLYECNRIGEAALRWISENPIVPTKEQVEAIWNSLPDARGAYPYWDKTCRVFGEWQRRMFLDPEPEVSDAVKKMSLRLMVYTFTEKERDYLFDIIRTATHPHS